MTPRPHFHHRNRDDETLKNTTMGALKATVAFIVLLALILMACYL